MNGGLRKAMAGNSPVVVPLCLDPLMARIAEQAGFELGYVSGGALGYSYAVSEALLTATEIADATRRITQRSSIDIIVDIGVGFGDPVHTARGIWEMQSAGAAGVEIEDQVAPKRVSHHRGIEHLVPTDVMVQKIEAAVAARSSEDFAIIARTGAVKNESYAAAIDRLREYQKAGADLLMLMPENDSQIDQTRGMLNGPLAAITTMDQLGHDKWKNSGWNLLIDPITAHVASVRAVVKAYEAFAARGETGLSGKEVFADYRQLSVRAGLAAFYEIEDNTTEKDAGS